MKKFLLAGMLALPVLVLSEAKASAWCWDIYCPNITLPLPKIPIFIPSLKFYCPEGCGTCPKCAHPWAKGCGGCGAGCGAASYDVYGGYGGGAWGAPWYAYYPDASGRAMYPSYGWDLINYGQGTQFPYWPGGGNGGTNQALRNNPAVQPTLQAYPGYSAGAAIPPAYRYGR